MRNISKPNFVFFFNDTATTEIYTLSLHDALPIYAARRGDPRAPGAGPGGEDPGPRCRSEEHTSELQSQSNLVCRRLLEQKKSRTETLDRHLLVHIQLGLGAVRDLGRSVVHQQSTP